MNLPLKLVPSELLSHERLPPFIDALLRGCRSLRRAGRGRLPEAERCATEALKGSQEPGTNASQAVALIHRADVYRDMDRLGPALADCQQAYRIFQNQSSHYHRHNEAVAAYALGLVHHWLGDEVRALRWYRKSGELFEEVKYEWIAVNALSQVDTCTRIRRWMETLSRYLTAVLTGTHVDVRIWAPVILSEEEGSVVEQLVVDKYVIGRELTARINPFQVHPLEECWRVSLTSDFEYDAQEIPDEMRRPLDAVAGDHALVQWEQRPEWLDRYDMEELGDTPLGNFMRHPDGSIHVVRASPWVIGEDGDGHITALLKPA